MGISSLPSVTATLSWKVGDIDDDDHDGDDDGDNGDDHDYDDDDDYDDNDDNNGEDQASLL